MSAEIPIVVRAELAESGTKIPENRVRTVHEIERDHNLCFLPRFRTIDWSFCRHSARRRGDLDRFKRWLARRPELAEEGSAALIVGHCLTLRKLTDMRTLRVPNAVILRHEMHIAKRGIFIVAPSGDTASRHIRGDDSHHRASERANRTAPTRPQNLTRVGARRAGRDEKERLRRAPKLIILCGFPGSGKSTLASALVRATSERRGSKWIRICQDELKTRARCEAELCGALKRGHRVILDRCNPTTAERGRWAELSGLPARSVGVVWFRVPAHVCRDRVAKRRDHPTIPFGGGARAVGHFVKVFEAPTLIEESTCRDGSYFRTLWTVTDVDSLDAAYRDLGGRGSLIAATTTNSTTKSSEVIDRGGGGCSLRLTPTALLVDVSSTSLAQRSIAAVQRVVVPTSGCIRASLHVTLIGSHALKGADPSALRSLRKRVRTIGGSIPPVCLERVARLATRGKSQRSVYLRVANPRAWHDFLWRLLADDVGLRKVAQAVRSERRVFHVTVWNSRGGRPRASIGDISLSDDRNGSFFERVFGRVEWPKEGRGVENEEQGKKEECAIVARKLPIMTPMLAARLSGERRRLDLDRLGASCRVAKDEKVECRFKFPKTLHCKDLGAMASDDLILSRAELDLFFGSTTVIVRVEEKVDGGNIGISLDPFVRNELDGRPAFRFQKRSHYVSSASEYQYRGLAQWARANCRALRKLLRMPIGKLGVAGASDDKPAALGQRIVFGEWLAATHSKAYDRLPSKFLVFDIFDSALRGGRGGFVSANVRDDMLRRVRGADGVDARTGLKRKLWRVRTCAYRSFACPDELVDLLYRTPVGRTVYMSSNDRCEGFYVRLDDEKRGILKGRCKLVHGLFHQQVCDGRWERSRASNVVRPDAWIGRSDDGTEGREVAQRVA